MEIKEVDPWQITVDKSNERQSGDANEELIENVKATGIIQPPLVRELNGEGMDAVMGAEYSVVVGGRRVDAARQAELDAIEVIVMPWDDTEATLASITENEFRKNVSKKDRAKAIERLKDLEGWTDGDVADRLGVDRRTVVNWLEWTRDEWVGTSIHADSPSNNVAANGQSENEPTDEAVQTARKLTGGGEKGERVVDAMERAGVRETSDVREVKNRVIERHGDDPDASDIEDVALEVAAEKQGFDPGPKHYIDFTATGDFAEAITYAAVDRGATYRELVGTATRQWLESEGYL